MAKAAAAKKEETKAVSIADVTIERAPQIFGVNSLSQFVAAVRAEVIGEVPDLTTKKGRDRIASLAASVARSKTAVDGVGRAYLKQLKGLPKVIEGELREFESDMNALRDEVRKPLNDFEAAEQARKDSIEDAIQAIIDLFTMGPDETCEQIENRRTFLTAVVVDLEKYQERHEEAEEKRNYGLLELTKAMAKRKKFEDDQAELERLRVESEKRAEEDRIRLASEQAVERERQRVAAEQQAQRDADAAKVRDSEERAQRAEQGRLAVERRAEEERQQAAQREEQARKDEQARQQRAADEIIRQQKAREADTAHRTAINKAALDAMLLVDVGGDPEHPVTLSQAEAKAIIVAIVRGQIPNVTLSY